MIAFLSLSIIPLLIAMLLFFQTYTQDITQQTTQHLTSVRDTQSQRLINFFDDLEQEIQGFANSELANATGGRFYGLVGAFQKLGLPPLKTDTARLTHLDQVVLNKSAKGRRTGHERYRLLHQRYHWAFEEYLKRSSFSNIVLTNAAGIAVYSPNPAAFFGVDIATNPQLSKLYQQLKSQKDPSNPSVVFSDFQENDRQAWFGVPIMKNDKVASYAFFLLKDTALFNLFSNFKESDAIQIQWVGDNGLTRFSNQSLPWLKYDSAWVIEKSNQKIVDTLLTQNGIEVLSAIQSVAVFGKHWHVFIEIPTHTAFAQIDQLKIAFFWGSFAAIILVIFVAHWLSNFITAPLLRLISATEQVANGDIHEPITLGDRQDEIGRLATSFAQMQTSLREKLALIEEQHREQEKNLATIKQKNLELKQSDKLKDEFLANTTHELRTPLHGMIAIAESLLSKAHGEITPEQAHQTQRLMNNGQRLAELIDDLLDYHQLRHGKFTVSSQVVDLSSIISVVIELSSHALAQKSIRLINHLDGKLPWVLADEQRLEQVIYHLLGHAIHSTDEGKIVLSAHCLNDQLRVQIIDTGCGIPEDQLEHLFEPLLHNTPSPHSVGLSISRHLISLMGGQLFVSSQELVGTTFSFTLPLAPEKAELSRNESHFLPLSDEFTLPLPENGTGPKILIVDDEPMNRQILNNLLRIEGYHVISAENGRQAIDLLKTESPELMLLDIMMPDMTGYDVCQRIRHKHHFPIILLSARHQVADRIKGFEFGANDYISKPFNRAELLARVNAHINSQNTKILMDKLREKTEINHALLTTQGQLLPLLANTKEAIVCLNENGEIRYANQAASVLFEQDLAQLYHCRIDDFLINKMPQANIGSHSIHYCIGKYSQSLNTQILSLPTVSGFSTLVIIENKNPSETERMALMEHAIHALTESVSIGHTEAITPLKALGGEFNQLALRLLESTNQDKPDRQRELLVETMKTALVCWETHTKKTKFDLAEESGLWRVYLDRSTLQTRTLDKYLHMETLPKTPRWRTVISTLEFVLKYGLESDPIYQKLEMQKEKLRQTLNESHRQNTF
jgi:two-component system sensor histidine kinase ChiS